MDSRKVDPEWERHWRRLALPMPEKCAELDYEEHFTVEESARLLRVVLPEDMADKWMVFFDDFRLSFHRSWTGFCVYAVTLVSPDPEEEPTHYCTCDAIVNRDRSQYTATDDAFDVALLSWLIRTLLLGQQVAYPIDPTKSAEDSLLSTWAFAGNAAFSAPVPDLAAATDADPVVDWSPPEIETD